MTLRSAAPVALVLASAVLVAGCGGGGDATGGVSNAFNVVPNELTLNGVDASNCGSGYAGRVFVFGGAPPYRVSNTDPSLIGVSRTSVDGSGGAFDVTYLNPTTVCFSSIKLVVTDQLGRQTVVNLNSVKGE